MSIWGPEPRVVGAQSPALRVTTWVCTPKHAAPRAEAATTQQGQPGQAPTPGTENWRIAITRQGLSTGWVSTIQETDSQPWCIRLSRAHLAGICPAPSPPPHSPSPHSAPADRTPQGPFSHIQGLLGPRSVLTKASIDVPISASLDAQGSCGV